MSLAAVTANVFDLEHAYLDLLAVRDGQQDLAEPAAGGKTALLSCLDIDFPDYVGRDDPAVTRGSGQPDLTEIRLPRHIEVR